jgi:acetolactate synthase I/II/III large subunit
MSVIDHTQTLTGGALVARLLADYGVECVFGVPSEAPQFVSRVFEAEQLRYVVLRDERAAPFAANVYAKLTGRIAVLDAAPSVGTTMMMAGLAEALNASIPMLGIFTETTQKAGAIRRLGAVNQATDQEAYLRPVVKYCARVDSVHALPSLLRTGLQLATSGRPGPVVLLVPYDVLEDDASGVTAGPTPPKLARMGSLRSAPPTTAVNAAADVLAAAARPVILAGGGVLLSGAGQSVLTLAEQAEIPVSTTLSGAGAIPEQHRLALGTAGFYGLPCPSQAMERADTLLLVGMKGNGYATWFWRHPRDGQKVIHLDIDPAEPGKMFPDALSLVGDAREGLEALTVAVAARPKPDRRAWLEEVGQLRAQTWEEIDSEHVSGQAHEGEMTSGVHLAWELDRRIGPGDVLLCEASQTTGWASRVRLPEGARRITFRGLGVLGGGVGGALGARLALGEASRVILFAGDGAMGYQIGELATLARLGSKVITIVLNNSSLGAVHIWPGMPAASADIGAIDFALAARACGCTGLRVDRPGQLAAALDEAFAADGPVLIDVGCDRNEWSPLSFDEHGVPIAPFEWE